MKKQLRDALSSLPALGATDGKPKNHKVIIYASNGWVWEAYESKVVEGWHSPDIMCFGKVRVRGRAWILDHIRNPYEWGKYCLDRNQRSGGFPMNQREELEETLELLWYAFEELKEIQDSLDAECVSSRIQELIWKIGKQLGEF
jgi:hypothetical protein